VTDASADTCKFVCHWLSPLFEKCAMCCRMQGERARGRRRGGSPSFVPLAAPPHSAAPARNPPHAVTQQRMPEKPSHRQQLPAHMENRPRLLCPLATQTRRRRPRAASRLRASVGAWRRPRRPRPRSARCARSVRPPQRLLPLGSAQLDLHGRQIGATGAAELAKALATNNTLTRVCMAWHGACIMGRGEGCTLMSDEMPPLPHAVPVILYWRSSISLTTRSAVLVLRSLRRPLRSTTRWLASAWRGAVHA